MKLHLTKKYLLISGSIIVALGIGGGAFVLRGDDSPIATKSASLVSNKPAQAKPESSTTPEPAAQIEPTSTPASTPSQPQQAETPTNPYPLGFNIWHVWNRRTELGLQTPTGVRADATWCRDVVNSQGYPYSSSPSQYAIICSSQGVIGVVEAVNDDGSATFSCTNCGAGWNTLTQKTIIAEQIARYRYLQ